MPSIVQLLLYSFLKSLKILRFKKKPTLKIPEKYRATPLDYTVVKLHIV